MRAILPIFIFDISFFIFFTYSKSDVNCSTFSAGRLHISLYLLDNFPISFEYKLFNISKISFPKSIADFGYFLSFLEVNGIVLLLHLFVLDFFVFHYFLLFRFLPFYFSYFIFYNLLYIILANISINFKNSAKKCLHKLGKKKSEIFKTLFSDSRWRRWADSNRRIRVLQTRALPLGYNAEYLKAIT